MLFQGCGTEKDIIVTEACNTTEGAGKIQESEAIVEIADTETVTDNEEKADLEAIETVEEPVETAPVDPRDAAWVGGLQVAQTTSQLIIVEGTGGANARVYMYQKDASGNWNRILECNGVIGSDGIGQASEYSCKTPQGVHGIAACFGSLPNPGTKIAYTQVDSSYYWVDDINSAYYNQFVTTNDPNLTEYNFSSENILAAGRDYHYVVALDYNSQCEKGAGSAFFLHVNPGNKVDTQGCVAILENDMLQVMQNIQWDCKIVIDYSDNLGYY